MDDLISRQDAVKAIKKMAWENDNKFGHARNILLDGAKELDSLPSANPDLSGYSDRLWKSAYASGHARCKDDAIEAIRKELCAEETESGREYAISFSGIKRVLNDLSIAQPDLLEDGTLLITVPQGMLEKVKRVMVDEFSTKFCKVMYQDETERKKGRWIIDKDCEGKSRTVTCNLCGHKEFNWNNPNYCENCGADMRGENNG